MSQAVQFTQNRRFWQDGRVVTAALAVLAFGIYALGFRAASFNWFNALGASTAHVLPGTLAGVTAWRAQSWIRKRAYIPVWFMHSVVAFATGLLWLVLMLAITFAAKPDIIGHVAEAASLSTLLSGITVYIAVAFIHAFLASRQLVAEGQAAVARAELSALRARVEPHFLYNTLETISGLISADPKAAEDAIARLGRMLRRVLDAPADSRADALMPLQEELALVHDYLQIEKLRLGKRLTVIERIDSDTLELGVPTLGIQTLVENAVTHGIAGKPQGGMVSVATSREGGKLVIVVADDGVGAQETTLAEGGLGLDLLRKRLKTHFAGQATFDVAAAPGHGVSIRITVPATEVE